MQDFIYPIIALTFFVIALIANRRFGLIGLALAAGSLIELAWRNSAGSIMNALGVYLSTKNILIVSIVIILLPSIVLMFHGRSCKSLVGRLLSAALFALASLTLIVKPLNELVVVTGVTSSLYTVVTNNSYAITGLCLIVAVIDVFLTKPHQSLPKNRKS